MREQARKTLRPRRLLQNY